MSPIAHGESGEKCQPTLQLPCSYRACSCSGFMAYLLYSFVSSVSLILFFFFQQWQAAAFTKQALINPLCTNCPELMDRQSYQLTGDYRRTSKANE